MALQVLVEDEQHDVDSDSNNSQPARLASKLCGIKVTNAVVAAIMHVCNM
jgi:hypothetical protein